MRLREFLALVKLQFQNDLADWREWRHYWIQLFAKIPADCKITQKRRCVP